MSKQALPQEIRNLTGIHQSITRQTRNRLLPLWRTGKFVIENKGACPFLSKEILDELCHTCKAFSPLGKLCIRYAEGKHQVTPVIDELPESCADTPQDATDKLY